MNIETYNVIAETIQQSGNNIIQRCQLINIAKDIFWLTIGITILIICIIIGVKMIKAWIKGIVKKESSMFIHIKQWKLINETEVEMTLLSSVLSMIIPIFIIVSIVLCVYISNDLIKWVCIPDIQIIELFKNITN